MAKFEFQGLLKMMLVVATALQLMAPVEAATDYKSWDYSTNWQCCRTFYIEGSNTYWTGPCRSGISQADCHTTHTK